MSREFLKSCAAAAVLAVATGSATAQILIPIDGVGNNVDNPTWGAAHQPLIRVADADYDDGLDAPGGAGRPSAREISNAVGTQVGDLPNEVGASSYVWQWGQFIDHDIDLSDPASPAEPFDIEIPLGDEKFDPDGMGGVLMSLSRSLAVHDQDGVRQQINSITSFLDASMVYGSDLQRAAELIGENGKLKLSEGDLLPFNVNGFANAPTSKDPTLFLAGDVRCNEQLGLTAMHTLFVREHNFLVDRVAGFEPNPLRRFLIARSFVMAEIQAITFNEFLPVLLGPGSIPAYGEYDDSVQPDIANEFSTAVYRIGHSMLPKELLALDADLNPLPGSPIALRDAFFTPATLPSFGIGPLLRGLAHQPAQHIDTKVVDDIRNFLFEEPRVAGFDLASLNIQRGRDHGLADYNAVRVALGLPARTSFEQINPGDSELTDALAALYGDVDDVDLWVGSLAEPHVNGGMVGETAFTALSDQFLRLRDGDRFWYENRLSDATIATVNNQTLAKIIRRNTDVAGDEIPDQVFLLADG